jgi:hypothetical protein
VISFSKTVVIISKTPRHHIPENNNLHFHHCENIKFHTPRVFLVHLYYTTQQILLNYFQDSIQNNHTCMSKKLCILHYNSHHKSKDNVLCLCRNNFKCWELKTCI